MMAAEKLVYLFFVSLCSLNFLGLLDATATKLVTCNTCQAPCDMEVEKCIADCQQKRGPDCNGLYCFTRLDTLENFYHFLQMGCSNFAPEGKSKIYNSGKKLTPTRYQYCDDGDFCNTDLEFLNKKLPADDDQGSCCELSFEDYYHYDEEMDWKTSCPSECKSSHCLTDYVNSAKFCTTQYPIFYADLNAKIISDIPDGLCVRYSATSSYATHMCSCKSDPKVYKLCNEQVKNPTYSRENRVKCYNCLQTGTGSIPSPLCDDHCWGSQCFLTLTSADILQAYDYSLGGYGPPKLEQGKYELIAGCVSTNLPPAQVLREGCRVEWLNSSDPISRHCLCNSNTCNTLDFALGFKPPPLGDTSQISSLTDNQDDGPVATTTAQPQPPATSEKVPTKVETQEPDQPDAAPVITVKPSEKTDPPKMELKDEPEPKHVAGPQKAQPETAPETETPITSAVTAISYYCMSLFLTLFTGALTCSLSYL